jgi:TetR/AcrR family transcriptional regulator, mexJK operon transcriptional repressor
MAKTQIAKNRTACGKARCGRPPASEATARIERILDIAAAIFMERGYEGTTMDDIARRAGASKHTLYARYRTKADLFRAVILRRAEAFHSRLSSILTFEKPIELVLEAVGMELAARAMREDAQKICRAVIATRNDFREPALTFWTLGPKQGFLLLAEFIKGQTQRGVLVTSNPQLAADVFHSLCFGKYLLPAQLGIGPVPTRAKQQAYIREAVKVFMAAYGR